MKTFPLLACVLAAALLIGRPADAAPPQNFLFADSGNLAADAALIARPDIAGAQVVYNWRELEPAEGKYDFSRIDADLATMDKAGKKLFVQIQDRFFSPRARNIPDYLLNDAQYDGGLAEQLDNAGEGKTGSGWVAMQWNPALRQRYQSLLTALARHLDGKVFGVDLPETSIDLDMKHPPKGFTCDAYFAAEMDNLAFARKAFAKSEIVQYVNFWPCEWDDDHHYMSRLFDYAAANGIGLGGPDVVPFRKPQMHNSYPFFNKFKGRLPLVAMAVQEPTLTYINPETGRRFTQNELVDFAGNYLGADIIFWTTSSRWLRK